jgi:hypothetical protein
MNFGFAVHYQFPLGLTVVFFYNSHRKDAMDNERYVQLPSII